MLAIIEDFSYGFERFQPPTLLIKLERRPQEQS
jgi:hypothetical protein